MWRATSTTSVMRLAQRGRRGWHDVCNCGRLGDANATTRWPWLSASQRLLHQRPLACSMLAATASAAVGDLLAQAVDASGLDAPRGAEWDGHYGSDWSAMASLHTEPKLVDGAQAERGLARTARYAAVAAALVGVAGEVWFRRLMFRVPGVKYQVAVRTILDQILYAPAVLAGTVGAVTLLSSADPAYSLHRIKVDGVHVLGKMWALWIGAASASYLLVAPPFQPLVALGTSVCWNGYVSLRVHRPVAGAASDFEHVPSYLRQERRWDSEQRSSAPDK